MKNFVLALTALAGLSAPAFALTPTGSAQDCNLNNSMFQYCISRINSVTTVAQLGKITYDPVTTRIYVVGTNSGTVSGVVTPTLNLYLGNKLVASQSVSLTTSGNVVNMGAIPYFDGMSVSISTPGLLGTSQSAVISIIQNSR